MARLRDPARGCPWDVQQDFATIAPYTIEEAYEVADAIARNNLDDLRDELGDLLFQVVFHARMAEEQGAFDFEAVAAGIADKMLRRHPHVFGSEEERSRGMEAGSWEAIKAAERAENAQNGAKPGAESALDGVPLALPALKRAQKLGKRAAATGFDWHSVDGPRKKIDEELAELAAAAETGSGERIADELGDLLFTVVNLARHHGADAEASLAAANVKFEQRFRHMESSASAAGIDLATLEPAALEAHWQAAKKAVDKT